jgi:polysaccharide chain length determinant protein (PEP-CTERM system associated)
MTARTPQDAMDDEAKKGHGLERLQAIWSRRKWLGLAAFALPFAAAIGLILGLPNLYRSTATVLVERQQVPEAFVRPTVTNEIDTRLRTISQEILSRARLESLIDRFNLYADLRKGRADSEEIVTRMRRDIQVEVNSSGRQPATIAFSLTYRGRDPKTVAEVTNTLASFYVEENLRARERQANGTTEFLRGQLSETKKRLDAQERRVSDFKQRHMGELPQQMQANLASMDTLNTQLRLNNDNQLRAGDRREALITQLAEAESLASAGVAPALPGVTPPAPAPDAPALHVARLRQELASAQARFTDAHPTVIRLKDELATAEREVVPEKPSPTAKTEPAPVPSAPPNPYVLRLRESLRAAEGEMKILKAEEQRLRGAIGSYQARVESTPRREQEFQDISRDYDSTKELHQSLMKRYEEAQLAESMEQRQKGEQFRILDPALPSSVTVAPNRPALVVVALVLSLGLGVAAAMLAEKLDTSFHSASELFASTAVPVLVSIPKILTEADLPRRRSRLRLGTAAALLALVVMVSASYTIAHGNERLVRILDRSS